jgi:3',5'-cyclic-AMP phosphodiesterase
MGDFIRFDHHHDGIDRRGFLTCMAWAGTGVLWAASGGVLRSNVLGSGSATRADHSFTFVQISDSHIGFNKEANHDVVATLGEAIGRINALPQPPDFVIHTGDLTHLSKPIEFDTLDQALRSVKTDHIFFVPGEHDVIGDHGAQFRQRHGQGTVGNGWFSFDHHGVHFVCLVNVMDLRAGGLGLLGDEHLAWLSHDLESQRTSTPIVVFAHIPLWSVYPDWGWATDDGARAMSYLKRFGSVTVLNGHIHQTVQKIEGNVTFHTAMSTAFPQPSPGSAPSPGPMTVPADRLRQVLGVTDVTYVQQRQALAVVDEPLAAGVPSGAAVEITIGNFRFSQAETSIARGTEVTWVNRDDMPHTVVASDSSFASPALDTGDHFSHVFDRPGTCAYYCSIHPKMTGRIVVR